MEHSAPSLENTERRSLTVQSLVWPTVLCCVLATVAAAFAEEPVNIARSLWGATATASSAYGPDYRADNVLDGRWARRETDKWNTAANVTPHWLRIDLGQVRPVNRVVIRHEGVVPGGESCLTSDFQLQRADGPDGPWLDLVPPIAGNRQPVTTHDFAPVELRYVRIWITKAEQNQNVYARLFEVEVYCVDPNLKLPDLARAEELLHEAEAGTLTAAQLRQAVAWLRHDDPFVRGVADWTIARKVGRDNDGEVAAWLKPQESEWFNRWTAQPLDTMIEHDWVRQARSLGIARNGQRLLASVDELLRRFERMAEDSPLTGAKATQAARQWVRIAEVRKEMDRHSADLPALRRLWLEARRAMRALTFAHAAFDFGQLLFYTRFAPHHKPNVCGVHSAWTYKPGGDLCLLTGLESGGKVTTLLNGQLGPGHLHGMDLSFDADSAVFGYAVQDYWPPVKPTLWPQPDNQCFAFALRNSTEPAHLYEIGTDGKGLLYRHPLYCAVSAMPFKPRQRPPTFRNTTDTGAGSSIFHVGCP